MGQWEVAAATGSSDRVCRDHTRCEARTASVCTSTYTGGGSSGSGDGASQGSGNNGDTTFPSGSGGTFPSGSGGVLPGGSGTNSNCPPGCANDLDTPEWVNNNQDGAPAWVVFADPFSGESTCELSIAVLNGGEFEPQVCELDTEVGEALREHCQCTCSTTPLSRGVSRIQSTFLLIGGVSVPRCVLLYKCRKNIAKSCSN